MSLLDPEEVCCGFTGKHHIEEKLPKQIAPENSCTNEISRDKRIEKLEIQVTRLSDEMEMIKNRQCNAESAIQRAVNRGLCGLGGRFRLLNEISVPQYACSISKEERSGSRSQCCSSSSTTSSSIRATNIKNNCADTPVKENENKVKEDKNDCAQFVLG